MKMENDKSSDDLAGAQFAAKQHLATVKLQAAIINGQGAAVRGEAVAEERPLYWAAINCSHMIDADVVKLYANPNLPGNALSQLGDRLDAAAAKLSARAADAPSEPMSKDVEWLMQCSDEARTSPELATTLRNNVMTGFKYRAADALDSQPTESAPVARRSPECQAMYDACPHCGGSGDVHSLDGEWRGSCDCAATQPTVAAQQGSIASDARELNLNAFATYDDYTIYVNEVRKLRASSAPVAPIAPDDRNTGLDDAVAVLKRHIEATDLTYKKGILITAANEILVLKFPQQEGSEAGNGCDLRAVHQFLMGESALEGVQFGEKHPTKAGAHWWRLNLRAALSKG